MSPTPNQAAEFKQRECLRQRVFRILCLSAVCVFVVCTQANAQFINPRYGRVLQEWEKYYQAALAAYHQDNFAEAEQQYFKARQELKKSGPDDPRLATVL